jgi:hypothetical protein
MRRWLALGLALGVVVRPAFAQSPRHAPPVGGFALGQLRSRVARTLACEAVRDSTAGLDSLYTSHGYVKCNREQPSQIWLHFVRDTLIEIEANLQNLPSLPPIPSGRVFEFDVFMRTVWERHRARATAIFGGRPDSVSVQSEKPNQYGQLRVTLIAHWPATTRHGWAGRYTIIGFINRGDLFVLALADIQDPCVTAVPWLTCAAPRGAPTSGRVRPDQDTRTSSPPTAAPTNGSPPSPTSSTGLPAPRTTA